MEIVTPICFLFTILLYFDCVLGLTYECDPTDVLFTKSRTGLEIFSTESLALDEQVVATSPSNCFNQCRNKGNACKSATFFDDTNACHLKNISRLTITTKIKHSPSAQYFEKRDCDVDFDSKIKFISLVKNATDCKDISKKGWSMDGVYGVEIPEEPSMYRSIRCRMSLLDGGWTVVQRRKYGDITFDKSWNEYKAGFGDLSKDFWYGNEKLHQLSKPNTDNEIIFELESYDGIFYYPFYDGFNIGDDDSKYEINIGAYQHVYGPALPPFPYETPRADGFDMVYYNGMKFSTFDSDNDARGSQHKPCSEAFKNTGWWYKNCAMCHLNSVFGTPIGAYQGIRWEQITDRSSKTRPLKSSAILIRKR
eukprot:TCONS_00008811-protein